MKRYRLRRVYDVNISPGPTARRRLSRVAFVEAYRVTGGGWMVRQFNPFGHFTEYGLLQGKLTEWRKGVYSWQTMRAAVSAAQKQWPSDNIYVFQY